MQIPQQLVSIALLVTIMFLGGCVPKTSTIHHVVLIELKNDTDQAALLADCDRLLPGIPGVTSYWCGIHGDFGRTGVDSSYDVALCIGFREDHAYTNYLVNPAHIELVTRWKPRFEWIRIHDVVSPTP